MNNMTTREVMQKKSRELGHCVCSKEVPCPCPYFLSMDICKCAMEGNISLEKWLETNKKSLAREAA